MTRKITALELQKRNRQRINVYLDGEFKFGLARIVAAWLQVGQELSEEKIELLLAQDNEEVAYQRALKFLDYRPRSEFELRRNLRKHKINDEVQDIVIRRLHENSLLDDERFASLWVENRCELRPRGKRLLQYELKQRGITEEIIQNTLETIDEEHLAYRAAKKQARKYESLEWNTFRKKMYGFLSRRGFGYATSSEVIDRVWADCNSTVENERRVER